MKKIYLSIFGLLLGLSPLIAQDCTGMYLEDITDSADFSTVEFGSAVNSLGATQTLQMDIYQPYNVSSEKRPVMILAFGGSFVGGNRKTEDMIHFAYEFAKKGYVCATIDYRLAQTTDLFFEKNMVQEVFRAVQDGKAAVRFFRKDAAETNVYDIDPDKIFVGGTSAGGILAVNLAYMDSEDKLPESWKPWLEEVGGLEGESGNPGFCSKPNGVFSFSGAVADTTWIESDDVPIYSAHSTEDQTVPYYTGRPLNGIAPISVQGSGEVHARMNTVGVYNVLDTYYDAAHPSFSSNNPDTNAVRIQDIEDHLTQFLFDIMYCNPSNKLNANVDKCIIDNVAENIGGSSFKLFPNPANNVLNIEGASGEYELVDFTGKVLKNIELTESGKRIDVSDIASGLYLIRNTNGSAEKVLIQ